VRIRIRRGILPIVAIAALAWAFRPHWKTICSSNEVTVKYREVGSYLQLNVKARSSVFPSFRFDYWQDGLHHTNDMLTPGNSKVEPVYGVVEDGAICTQYGIFDISATNNGSTTCGGLVSSATVTDFTRDTTQWEYTITLPKKELSSGESASMVIDFWDEATQSQNSYPPARFKGPVRIQYGRGLFDLQRLFH
jgi:hypothetical protein